MNANAEELGGTNTSQLKKRKAAPSSSVLERFSEDGQGSKKPRLLRGLRGTLEKVLSLPFDIQFEIFGHLTPADILSLGRCSRELHDFVGCPGFRCIWARSRSNTFPTLPECPDDMTEPAYAELVFGKGCLACGKANLRLTQRYHIWEARTRLCPQCIQTLWINTESKEYRRGLPQPLLKYLPSCNLMDPSGAPYDGECYVPRSIHRLWSQHYNSFKLPLEREEWVNAKMQERVAIKKHSDRIQDFYVLYQEQLTLEKGKMARNAILQRKAKVLELIKSLGWAEDLAKHPGNFFVDYPDIARLCQQPLTDRVVEMLKPQLNAIMGPIREARLEAEQQASYEARMRLLKRCYAEALRSYPVCQPRPRTSDIYAIPRIRTLITDTPTSRIITNNDFNITPDTLSDVIEEANNLTKSKLLSLMAAQIPDKVVDTTTALYLATAVFYPTIAGIPAEAEVWFVQQAIEAPIACKLQHRGHCHVQKLNNAAFQILGGLPWNNYSVISFHRKAHDILCRVVEMCGFDPKSATLDEVEQTNPIVECLTCNTYNTGRCLMPWSFTAHHTLRDHHGLFPDNHAEFALVSTKEDAEKARLVFKEMREKELFSCNTRSVCAHCQRVYPAADIREHMHTTHSIIYPQDGDIKFIYEHATTDSIRTPREYRLWPPHPSKTFARGLSKSTVKIIL